MPVVSVLRDRLFERLEKQYTQEEFEDVCFDFGIELDDVTSEKERVRREQGEEAAKGLSEDVIYKIEVPANRYDLLCIEGIAAALRVFNGLSQVNKIVPSQASETITVSSETKQVRPFVVSAILKNINFNDESYANFIDLQEKLHQNICRERTLVAIGTHDYDKIEGPFSYEALKPEDIKFVPLKEEKEFTAKELFHYYEFEKAQSPLKKYLHIIKDSPVFPVIYDSKRRVLSLPPIINGEHSKITPQTKNVFIECTATDLTKANIVLDTICSMFAEYLADSSAGVEAVNVEYSSGEKVTTPLLTTREFVADSEYLNKSIGIDISVEEQCKLLNRMMLQASVSTKNGKSAVAVLAPPTRSDILHPCDVMEDVAISYGFNNLERTLPRCMTIGRQQGIMKLLELIRENVAQAGFLEVLNWALISKKDNFEKLLVTEQKILDSAVLLGGNRKTADFEVVRTSLLGGLLKTLGHNRAKVNLPVQLFECGDVCVVDESTSVGARNETKLAAVYCGKTSGFEIIHGLLDRVMEVNGVAFREGEQSDNTYSLREFSNSTYFPKLCAEIVLTRRGEDVVIGNMGVLHPQVLENFSIDAPCSVLEIDLGVFL